MRNFGAVLAFAVLLGCKPVANGYASGWSSESALISSGKSAGEKPNERVYDWSTADLSWIGGGSDHLAEYDGSRSICASLLQAEPAASDWPSPEERAALKGCDSEKLYYGIGVPADPVKARQCALIEREAGDDPDIVLNYFRGAGILAMVYANGRGADRNFDVAIHMACGVDDAPAAMDGRIIRLAELRAKGWAGSDFGICDQATSGLSGAFCVGHDADVAAAARAVVINRIATRWTAAQKTRFMASYNLFEKYAGEAHAMDCWGGSAQAACAIAGREKEMERFMKHMEQLSLDKLPTAPELTDPDEENESAVALMTDDRGWKEFVADMDKYDRAWYEGNRKDTLASRRKFESALLAFTRATYPQYSDHQIRRAFADL